LLIDHAAKWKAVIRVWGTTHHLNKGKLSTKLNTNLGKV